MCSCLPRGTAAASKGRQPLWCVGGAATRALTRYSVPAEAAGGRASPLGPPSLRENSMRSSGVSPSCAADKAATAGGGQPCRATVAGSTHMLN